MHGTIHRLFCISLILVFSGPVFAFGGGITGYSGNPASAGGGASCSLCHNTGLTPVVALSGPASVAPGSITRYRFTINDSPQLVGGLNVSTSSGILLVPSGDTRIKRIGNELTHTQPAPITGTVTWDFDWQAPAAPGIYTVYAAGVAADNDRTAAGDSSAIDSLAITVAPQGPIPTAVIISQPTAVVNASIDFDASDSTAPAGATVNRFDWNVDGNDFANTGPLHSATFTTRGWHRVTLTVTDSDNASATTFVDVYVGDTTIPVVDPGGPYSGDPDAPIGFDVSGSISDPSTALVNYIWDFGDGSAVEQGASPTRSHTREMIFEKITSVPGMNSIVLDSAEAQLIADFLGSGAGTTGNSLYDVRCAICHGGAGTGIAGVGPFVRGATQSMILDAIIDFGIMNGIILSSAEAQLVANYLGSGGSTGQDFYINKCEICHGPSGIGGRAAFVKGATRFMIQGEIGRITDMNGILVTSQQAQQIADYLGAGGATGQDLYTNRCLICHGQDGNGDSGPYDGGGIRGERASDYFDAIDDKNEMNGILLNATEAQAIQNYLNGGGG